ncbi:hypothetical protein RAAC3_TM7C00001G0264 [Candidatus Saccharibacteria bacterium RAAC3_TM7_1]|nr:hypothetical protein RAAC3_TM7C00001G0264 [Candidatus Saccharibacteria bacterium RAAC3_TM7_1]HCZ28250.1 hypothetical protein [Candidatus Saccharibacteria bacterium]
MNPIVWTELISVVAILCIIALTIGNIVASSGWQKVGWLVAGLLSATVITILALGARSQW